MTTNKNKYQYAYVKKQIIKNIENGKYSINEKIPTEHQLCEMFNTSRVTIRKALDQLVLEGYLVKRQGSGTFVAEKKTRQTLSYTAHQFKEQAKLQGKNPDITLISLNVIPADIFLQEQLLINLGDPVQRIERVRKIDNSPVQYEISYIPWYIAPGISSQNAENSIYKTLENSFNVTVSYTTKNLNIMMADNQLSFYLECQLGLPCFYITTIAKDDKDRRIEFSKAYFRGDKNDFTIERSFP